MENTDRDLPRRKFLHGGLILSAAVLAGSQRIAAAAEKEESKEKGDEEEEVSPVEDLMREHGVLKRVLLVYDEAIRRITKNEDLPPEPVADATKIIREFIEDYHEKLEEKYLFPRFEKAGKLVDLVKTLHEQHDGGRQVTDLTMNLIKGGIPKDAADRARLVESLRQFVRMYAPHEAREDTVLFPAFRKIVSKNEYDSLGEEFEKKEHELFGEDGFEKVVHRVANIEKALGIYELSQFTPNIERVKEAGSR